MENVYPVSKPYIVHNYGPDGTVCFTTHFRIVKADGEDGIAFGRAYRSPADQHDRRKANLIASGRLQHICITNPNSENTYRHLTWNDSISPVMGITDAEDNLFTPAERKVIEVALNHLADRAYNEIGA